VRAGRPLLVVLSGPRRSIEIVGIARHTAPVTDTDIDAVIDELLANPIGAADVRVDVPASPGLYAWWADPVVFPHLAGAPHPTVPDLRLLYVGIASKLRSLEGATARPRGGPGARRLDATGAQPQKLSH
jgi:hypothetical protein